MYYSKEELPTKQAAKKLWRICDHSYDHGSPWTEKQFDVDLAQETSHYLVLIKEGKWIGFVSYHLVLDEVEITHVVIRKECQQKGYGSQLIDQLIQRVNEQDACQVFLEVRTSNVYAQNLYERKGFNAINRRKKYYSNPQEDGIVMCLTVKEVKQ